MLLGAGLTLMSIQRLSALLPYLGAVQWAPLTEILFIASRLLLLWSLISFVALGRGFSEALLLLPTYPEAFPPLVDALVAALWFAEWIKRDRLLAFSTLFFVASAVSGLLYSIPDPVKPVVAALILPLHLSILPAWRKTSAALAVLSMLDES